jgi:tripartite-type tricarboxylate transporter receptor subunit TctC
MSLPSSLLRGVCAALLMAFAAIPARSEDFPNRPVRVIVQTAAGSALDVLARIVNEQLAQIWGKDVIVVNQAGAGGLNAARLAVAAPPDGYTLFLAGGSVFVAMPELHRDLPFRVSDFAPIGFVADEPYGILASRRLGVKSLAELIAASKQQAGGLNAVAGTVGGLQHLTAERFREVSGAHLNLIHYPGTAQSLGDVISGRVPVMFQNLLPVAGVMASGEVELLAIASSARLPNFPTTPTAAETLPGFTASGWSVMVAPPGTPAPIVAKINRDLRQALSQPALLKKFQEMGNYTKPMTPQELGEYIAVERKQWGPIVQKVAAESQ